MEMSESGLTRLLEREGMRRTAYRDSAGVWTICVGHTTAAGLPKVRPGMKCTLAECRQILMRDVAQFEKCVEAAITRPMSQHQFDAIGEPGLQHRLSRVQEIVSCQGVQPGP